MHHVRWYPMFAPGRRVTRWFGDNVVGGKLTDDRDSDAEDGAVRLHRVEYDDGDVEDLNEAELRTTLTPRKGGEWIRYDGLYIGQVVAVEPYDGVYNTYGIRADFFVPSNDPQWSSSTVHTKWSPRGECRFELLASPSDEDTARRTNLAESTKIVKEGFRVDVAHWFRTHFLAPLRAHPVLIGAVSDAVLKQRLMEIGDRVRRF